MAFTNLDWVWTMISVIWFGAFDFLIVSFAVGPQVPHPTKAPASSDPVTRGCACCTTYDKGCMLLTIVILWVVRVTATVLFWQQFDRMSTIETGAFATWLIAQFLFFLYLIHFLQLGHYGMALIYLIVSILVLIASVVCTGLGDWSNGGWVAMGLEIVVVLIYLALIYATYQTYHASSHDFYDAPSSSASTTTTTTTVVHTHEDEIHLTGPPEGHMLNEPHPLASSRSFPYRNKR